MYVTALGWKLSCYGDTCHKACSVYRTVAFGTEIRSPRERVEHPCIATPLPILAGDYILWLDWDSSPGFALDCNFKDQGVKKPYCLIQGNHLNLMDECNAIKDCDGFTTQISDNGRFGYLVRYEGWASARQREGWMFFAKSSSNPTKKSKGRRRLQHVNTTIAGP